MPADSTLVIAGDERRIENLFQSLTIRSKHEDFIRRAVDFMVERVVFGRSTRTAKVVEWAPPEDIKKTIDLKLTDGPVSHEQLLSLMADVARYSVNTAHPYFVNQLYSSLDPYGLIGQWLTDALNPSVYTFEVAPVLTLMEEEVLREMRKIVGYPDGEGDGIFCPGGSLANGYAISCARFHHYPETKTKGVYAVPKLVLFTSDLAHYSTRKMAAFMGIGSDNCIQIKTDEFGKMNVKDLEVKIKEATKAGCTPFMVTATSGTTVFGAFDPLLAIVAVCKKHKLWLHVDAAWGGGALMSKTHRHLLRGIELYEDDVIVISPAPVPFYWNIAMQHDCLAADIGTALHKRTPPWHWRDCEFSSETHLLIARLQDITVREVDFRADSVTWNPHKLLAAPQQCSTFLTKHKNVLKECHSSHATYLFQKDKFYDTSYDTGDKHIQCGRRADVLKFWFMWKAKGHEGFEKHVDKLFDNAKFFLEHIKQRDGFELVLQNPECTNVMFWYVPKCLRGCGSDPDYNERLHKVAPKIKERMIKEGCMMVTYQPQGSLVNFFRIVFQNSALDHKDMIYFANEFERLGSDLIV